MKTPLAYQFCAETGSDIRYFVKSGPMRKRYPIIARRTWRRFMAWKRDRGITP